MYAPIHGNPFGGKCIHGKDGAIMIRGSLTNPKCSHCAQMVTPCR